MVDKFQIWADRGIAKTMKPIFIHEDREYCVTDITNILKQAGIEGGDSIFVHSDLKSFGKIDRTMTREGFLGSFFESLLETVGVNGNIIMPAFSYSFCRDEIYDPKTTPSRVGILAEYFRKLEGVKRSADAIFSVAAFGPEKDYFTDVGVNCFGEKSIFEKLYKRNVKIVFVGETFDMTYLHFIEQKHGVPYRFIKEFSGKIKKEDMLEEFVFQYYVRSLDVNVVYDLEGMANFLESVGTLKKVGLGNSKIRVAKAADMFNQMKRKFEDNVVWCLDAESEALWKASSLA